jgi:1-acyl-sn-glycerol-3-phosphate acyltransferase
MSAARPGDLDAHDPAVLESLGARLSWLVRHYFRADVRGLETLPPGPFLGVGNHSGAVLIPDTLVWLGAYQAARRRPHLVTLAHDQMFDAYPTAVARALAGMGAIRASHAAALAAFRRGYAVQVYPGGDFDACRSVFHRDDIVFAGRTGYVELAREAGVPIVPVVSVGGHEALVVLWDGAPLARALGLHKRFRLRTLPLSFSVPWGFWLGPLPGYLPLPTKISVRVLAPIDATRGSIESVDAQVRDAMQREARVLRAARRWPWLH